MRYLLVVLLLLNFGYFGWSLLAPPRSQSSPEPIPLRDSGLQLVSESRAAEREQTRARIQEEAAGICLFVSGFADIFEASEFAAAMVNDELEATVYVPQDSNAAEVRLERIPQDRDELPQWPDFAARSPGLSAGENPCEMLCGLRNISELSS